jgi:hypothetical protein
MSAVASTHARTSLLEMRVLCGVLAIVVLVDALWVRAPGLALLALPYAIGAVGMRRGRVVPTVVIALFAALYVFVGANFAIASGFDAPGGDLVFAYLGTPVAALLLIVAIRRVLSGAPRTSMR